MAAPRASYVHNAEQLLRLLLSLRAVGTTLPVRVLLSGERPHAALEDQIRSLGALVVEADGFATATPAWARRSRSYQCRE